MPTRVLYIISMSEERYSMQTAQNPQSMQLSENDNDVGHETPTFLLDDLRSGLFEPADNVAMRPGGEPARHTASSTSLM